jgi:hypothetical protein
LTSFGDKDFRGGSPRFAGEAKPGDRRGRPRCRRCQGRCPGPGRTGLVYAQADRLGVPVAPIPGTKRVKWLEQNVAALDLTLTADEMAVLDPLAQQVVGARY